MAPRLRTRPAAAAAASPAAAAAASPAARAPSDVLDPLYAAMLRYLRWTGKLSAAGLSAEDFRARSKTASPQQPVGRVQDVRIPRAAAAGGDLAARVYRPPCCSDSERPPVLVWLHGGGWVSGSAREHDGICRVLCNAARCVVLAINYRLAPEAPFPAAFEDVLAALRWAAASADAPPLLADGARLAVAGDSAGGNLAAAASLHLKHTGGPRLRALLLLYPALDATAEAPSYAEFARSGTLTAAQMRVFWAEYLLEPAAAVARADARVSPLRAPASALAAHPRTLLVTAGCDVLRDEGEAYAARLRAAGAHCELLRLRGVFHGFLQAGPLFDEAERTLLHAGAFLRAALGVKSVPLNLAARAHQALWRARLLTRRVITCAQLRLLCALVVPPLDGCETAQ